MGKKKFGAKGDKGVTFRLVHRSQQDRAAVEGEGEDGGAPSEFVLVPAEQIAARDKGRLTHRHNRPGAQQQRQYDGEHDDGGRRVRLPPGGLRDHINALGLPDDGTGYDYGAHMKTMGGGTFISKDGKVGAAAVPPAPPALPAEALPDGGGEVARNLTAITISDRVMDDDMRAIINGDVEEFEELEDDFVLQAAGDGDDDDGGFDFDAHIARLIAASEMEVGLRPRRRGDGDGDGDSDSDGDHDGSEVDTFSESSGGGGGGGGARDPQEEAALAAQFEATLAEYDSDDWGEGRSVSDDGDGDGEGESEGGITSAVADAAMDEFLREQADMNWFDGLGRQTADVPRTRTTTTTTTTTTAVAAGAPTGGGLRLGSLRGLGGAAAAAPAPAAEEESDDGSEGGDAFVPIDESFDYFRKPPEERWDCETVLSTYSNLDNHPTVLKVSRSGTRRSRSRPEAAAAGAAATANGDEAPPQIVLSRKTGLPLGVLDDRRGGGANGGDAGGGEGGSDGSDGEEPVNKGAARAKGEGAEERRARKARVKEERRARRSERGAAKAAFKEGGKAAARVLGNAETASRRSVFAYS